MTTIAQNLAEVKSRINAAAKKSGRDPSDVTLVAISKVHSVSAIEAAAATGQRHFGENYAQELAEKHRSLTQYPDITWHFIGHLQRNKAKLVVPTGAVIETVDSLRLAQTLSSEAAHHDVSLSVLIQVNVGQEIQKSGIAPDELAGLLDAIEKTDRITPMGLMTIPPWNLEPEETRGYFAALRRLRDQTGGENRLPHLSMGMSHDYEVAVEEGATLVRVGTAIFGQRPIRR